LTRRVVFWLGVCLVNFALAGLVASLAPSDVGTTADRLGYQYVSQHPLAADCPHNIFCYRLGVPILVGPIPLPDVDSWRALAVVANAIDGILLGALAAAAGAGVSAALIAAILFQASFGATFSVFDPFTPDALFMCLGAMLALCWWYDRPFVALGIGLVGIFVKETVALLVSIAALAACLHPQAGSRKRWLSVALVTWLVLLAFHASMDIFAGWSEAGSGSADLLHGGWLFRWLTDPTLTLASRVLYLFIPFGFAWLYAVLGARYAPQRLRLLGLASLLLLPLLVYVQTPERALATASFIVVPLAAIYLARLPLVLALTAAVTNGLLIARVGLSTSSLPPVGYLLIVAGVVAALAIAYGALGSGLIARFSVTSSRVSSLR
jgi:hypothetical protein